MLVLGVQDQVSSELESIEARLKTRMPMLESPEPVPGSIEVEPKTPMPRSIEAELEVPVPMPNALTIGSNPQRWSAGSRYQSSHP